MSGMPKFSSKSNTLPPNFVQQSHQSVSHVSPQITSNASTKFLTFNGGILEPLTSTGDVYDRFRCCFHKNYSIARVDMSNKSQIFQLNFTPQDEFNTEARTKLFNYREELARLVSKRRAEEAEKKRIVRIQTHNSRLSGEDGGSADVPVVGASHNNSMKNVQAMNRIKSARIMAYQHQQNSGDYANQPVLIEERREQLAKIPAIASMSAGAPPLTHSRISLRPKTTSSSAALRRKDITNHNFQQQQKHRLSTAVSSKNANFNSVVPLFNHHRAFSELESSGFDYSNMKNDPHASKERPIFTRSSRCFSAR